MISPDFVSSAAPTLNLEYGDTEPSRAFAAAAINLSRSSRREEALTFSSFFILHSSFEIKLCKVFYQLRAGFFHALRRFQNFRVRQISFADARRQIGDARNRRDVQSTLPRYNRLRHGAHADRVRAEFGERANLRRRLVTRPAHRQINPALQFQS